MEAGGPQATFVHQLLAPSRATLLGYRRQENTGTFLSQSHHSAVREWLSLGTSVVSVMRVPPSYERGLGETSG